VCVQGSYQPQHGQTACITCPIGTTAPPGFRQCVECAAGQYLDTASLTCEFCNPGTFNNETGRSACPQCFPGFYQPASGQSQCIPCAPGTNTTSSGQTQCTPCPLVCHVTCSSLVRVSTHWFDWCALLQGTFQTDPGQALCTPCPGIHLPARLCISCGQF
jgi:hypothetical protein